MDHGEEQTQWGRGGDVMLTAKGSDGRVDGLDQDALAVKLQGDKSRLARGAGARGAGAMSETGQMLTSSREEPSRTIQPSSITSAESLVT